MAVARPIAALMITLAVGCSQPSSATRVGATADVHALRLTTFATYPAAVRAAALSQLAKMAVPEYFDFATAGSPQSLELKAARAQAVLLSVRLPTMQALWTAAGFDLYKMTQTPNPAGLGLLYVQVTASWSDFACSQTHLDLGQNLVDAAITLAEKYYNRPLNTPQPDPQLFSELKELGYPDPWNGYILNMKCFNFQQTPNDPTAAPVNSQNDGCLVGGQNRCNGNSASPPADATS